jgi:hypothetical protein
MVVCADRSSGVRGRARCQGGISGAADEELDEKSGGDGLRCLYAL